MWIGIIGILIGLVFAIPKTRHYIFEKMPFLNIHKEEFNHDIKTFTRLIENPSWRKENINSKEVWVYSKDNTFQIEIGDSEGEFSEAWTQVYPDKMGSSKSKVSLKIKGVVVKQITFISCDGCRIFVALPKKEVIDGKIEYLWNKRSLEYKLTKLIGEFDIHKNIESVAKFSKIKII